MFPYTPPPYHGIPALRNPGTHNPALHTNPRYPYFSNQPRNDAHTCANDVAYQKPLTWCAAQLPKEASKLSDQKIRDSCIQHLQLAGNLTRDPMSRYSKFFVGCGFRTWAR